MVVLLTKIPPSLAIVRFDLRDNSEEFERFIISLATLEQHTDRVHGGR